MEIVWLHHDIPLAEHPGQEKTLELLERSYFWSGMATYVKNYISWCDWCAHFKGSNIAQPGKLQPLDIPNIPWMDVPVDFITDLPLSNGYVVWSHSLGLLFNGLSQFSLFILSYLINSDFKLWDSLWELTYLMSFTISQTCVCLMANLVLLNLTLFLTVHFCAVHGYAAIHMCSPHVMLYLPFCHSWKCSTPSLPLFLLPPCHNRDNNNNGTMSMLPPHHHALRLPPLHMTRMAWCDSDDDNLDNNRLCHHHMMAICPGLYHHHNTTVMTTTTFWSCPPPHPQALLIYDVTSWQWWHALGHTPPLQPNDDNMELMLPCGSVSHDDSDNNDMPQAMPLLQWDNNDNVPWVMPPPLQDDLDDNINNVNMPHAVLPPPQDDSGSSSSSTTHATKTTMEQWHHLCHQNDNTVSPPPPPPLQWQQQWQHCVTTTTTTTTTSTTTTTEQWHHLCHRNNDDNNNTMSPQPTLSLQQQWQRHGGTTHATEMTTMTTCQHHCINDDDNGMVAPAVPPKWQ